MTRRKVFIQGKVGAGIVSAHQIVSAHDVVVAHFMSLLVYLAKTRFISRAERCHLRTPPIDKGQTKGPRVIY